MPDVLIRDVPDDVANRLKMAAISHGRTLEAEALEIVRRGVADLQDSRFTIEQARARVARNLARFSEVVPSISLDEVREGLEGAT